MRSAAAFGRRAAAVAELRGIERDAGIRRLLHREFPRQAGEWNDPASRRSFLKLMAASLGLAGVGLSGCLRQPEEKIVPYVRQPEDVVPGKPLYFATCTTLGGYATGLLGREPPRPADEDRRQPRSSGQPGRDRRLRAGVDPLAVRSRPFADRHERRPDQHVGRVFDGA